MPESPLESVAIACAPAAEIDQSHAASAVEREVLDLFDQFREPLLRYVLAFSLSVSDSEDLVQETFLALFQHLQRGKSRHHLRGWLFRVAHNLALKRRSQRNPSDSTIVAEGSFVDPALSPEEQCVMTQTRERLLSVLKALPERGQRCLYLRAEGLRYREIAEVLDISLGSVSVYLERSLAHIARALQR